MSAQPSLPFGTFHAVRRPQVETPAARSTDPASSHAAAKRITATGRRGEHQRHVLALIQAHPGKTTGELARLTSMERHEVARRAPELRTAGLVRNGATRKCEALGSMAMTWWPVEVTP